MSVKIRVRPLSSEEYLEGELHSEVKHELVGGQAYAMVGANNIHNLIAGALFAALSQHLKGSPYRTFMSDMKVRQGDNFYYPDLVVTGQSATGIYYSELTRRSSWRCCHRPQNGRIGWRSA